MYTLDLLKELLERHYTLICYADQAVLSGQYSLALQVLEEARPLLEQVREIAFQTGSGGLVVETNDLLVSLDKNIKNIKDVQELLKTVYDLDAKTRQVRTVH